MPSVRRLKTPENIRAALAWIWREIQSGRMDPQKGRALIYCSLSLAQLVSDGELEARITALEERLAANPERLRRGA